MPFFSFKRELTFLPLCAFLLLPALAIQDGGTQQQQQGSVALPSSIEQASDDSREPILSFSAESKVERVVNIPYSMSGESKTLVLLDVKENAVKREYNFGDYISKKVKPSSYRAHISNPIFSDDGKHIIFKYVVYESFYQLYSFDVNSESFAMVSKDLLTYHYNSISSDGRYVAFIFGGDSIGDVSSSDVYSGPLQLFVVDLKENTRHLVAQGDFLNGSLLWDRDGNLFYSAEKQYKKNLPAEEVEVGIYSYNARTGKNTLIEKNGFMPFPSPDGSQVLFYGPPNADEPINWTRNWRESPFSGISLLSVTTADNRRTAYEPAGANYPSVSWLVDNRQFVSLREVSSTPNALARLQVWDTQTQNTKSVADIPAEDKTSFLRPNRNSQFKIINAGLSNVEVSKSEFLGFNAKGSISITRKTLLSVDVATGEVRKQAEFVNTLGFDVHLK